jgi:hypothetical protein
MEAVLAQKKQEELMICDLRFRPNLLSRASYLIDNGFFSLRCYDRRSV